MAKLFRVKNHIFYVRVASRQPLSERYFLVPRDKKLIHKYFCIEKSEPKDGESTFWIFIWMFCIGVQTINEN